MTPEFIARFPSAAQEHMHFENGSSPWSEPSRPPRRNPGFSIT